MLPVPGPTPNPHHVGRLRVPCMPACSMAQALPVRASVQGVTTTAYVGGLAALHTTAVCIKTSSPWPPRHKWRLATFVYVACVLPALYTAVQGATCCVDTMYKFWSCHH